MREVARWPLVGQLHAPRRSGELPRRSATCRTSRGGFYDYVPPPRVDLAGYGLRVPGIAISPWARRASAEPRGMTPTRLQQSGA